MESNLDTRLPKLGCSVVVVVYGFIAFVLASQLLQLADDLSTFIVLFVKKLVSLTFLFLSLLVVKVNLLEKQAICSHKCAWKWVECEECGHWYHCVCASLSCKNAEPVNFVCVGQYWGDRVGNVQMSQVPSIL